MICSLLTATTTTAQNEQSRDVRRHELSVYGKGGYSPLSYTLADNGTKSGSIGGGAGAGYVFNINPSLGIVTGIEMSTYSSEASFGSVSRTYRAGTDEREMEFTYSLKDYRETQSVTLFSVPVMAQYSLPVGGGSTSFYVSGGFKLGFPVNATADIIPGIATTKVRFLHENVNYEKLPQNALLDNEKLPDLSRDVDLGLSVALSLETGVRFTLSDRIGLYTGLYFDYGLNSVRKTDDRNLLEYEYSFNVNESKLRSNSVLDSGLIDKVNLISIGLKLRIGFRL